MKRIGRREFHVQAAAALAGSSLWLGQQARGDESQEELGRPNTGPRVRPNLLYALSTGSWMREAKPGQPLPLLRILDETAAAGFNGVRLTHYPMILEQNGLTLEQFGDELDQRGLKFCTIGFGGRYYDRNQQEEIMERAREVFRIHQHFGATTAVIYPPPPPEDGDEDEAFILMGNFLNSMCRMAKEHYGVRVGMRNYLYTMISDKGQIDRFMNTTDPRFVYFAWDTGHLHVGLNATSVVELFRATRGRIVQVAYNDATRRPGREDYIAPNGEEFGGTTGLGRYYNSFHELGRGYVDFPTLHEILEGEEYRGWITVSLETIRRSCAHSADIAMSYIRSKLDPIYE